MATPTLIFCGGNNRKFAEIAINAGYRYGSRLPSTTYADIYFADQNWKKPDKYIYMRDLKRLRPYMATVLDWERMDQLEEVIDWATEASKYVQVVVIIPKVHSGIRLLPRQIGNTEVRLGYSVPTKHGGTDVFLSEFIGWPVHLLGGSPGKQMLLAQYLDVRSADGNMAMKMATSRCLYWEPGKSFGSNAWIPIDKRGEPDGPFIAFDNSCRNIVDTWKGLI